MLTVTALSARGKASSGADVLAYLQAAEYYLGADGSNRATSRWLGRGSVALGLHPDAPVGIDTMTALSQGFAPDGTPLCRNAGATDAWMPYLGADGQPLLDADGHARGRNTGGHRVGFDLTFSSDKTIGVVLALASDAERERLIAAHRDAVRTALAYIEDQVETRRGAQGREVQGVRGLVVSGHTHFSSRDLDPQLHEHCLVYGIAQASDESWGTFDAEALYRHQRAAGAIYRAELAHAMRTLGYHINVAVERDERGEAAGEVWTHIAGIDLGLVEAFSKRRAAILERMQRTGESAQQATMSTRKEKDEPPLPELLALWTQSLEQLRREGVIPVPESTEVLKRDGRDDLRSVSDRDILREVQDRTAILTREAVLERVALARSGRMTAQQILADTDRILADRALLVEVAPERLPDATPADAVPGQRYTAVRYVMREHLDLEDRVLVSARARRDDPSMRIDPLRAAGVVARVEQQQGWALSAEQHHAIRHLTAETGGLAILAGRAGAGKTSAMRAATAAWQDQGRAVLGTAVGWAAATKLEDEANIPSRSLAAMLGEIEQGDLKLSARSVIILDEAGMAGTRHLASLQKAVDRAGGKLVLVGDEMQLQSIDAGGLFGTLSRTEGHAALTEIRRQRDASDRNTARMFYRDADEEERGGRRQVLTQGQAKERGGAILERLIQRGQVHAHETRPEAIAAITQAYRAHPAAETDKLILAGTRSDTRALNEAVRAVKRDASELTGPEARIATQADGVVTLQAGDRIRWTKRDKALGVINGSHGRVEAIDPERRTVRIRVEGENRVLTLDSRAQNNLTHGYASTVHRAQGQGKEAVWQLAHPGMADQQSCLVGFTRAVGRYEIHGADLDLERIEMRLGLDRRSWSAREAGVIEPMPPALTPPAPPARERERWMER
ncbi:MAG: MobF family relaxase [Vulcanimicrobiaceae bacterium]